MRLPSAAMMMTGAAAFVVGAVAGGSVEHWRMSRTPNAAARVQGGDQAAGQKGPAAARTEAVTASTRSVIVNGVRLSDQDIATLASRYQVRILDGTYWYDRMNGSWGRQGGPVEGFIVAGLDIGGPLREDASNGHTGVYINGRELHPVDVQRLSLLGPVYPGRCWMDAQGNIGLEGQPPFANVWVAARALGGGGGGRREGILSTYDKTGVAVFGY